MDCCALRPPKSFNIELLSGQGGRTPAVYYPGSTIEGNVEIELTEPLRPILAIKVMLDGRGFTSWIADIRTIQGQIIFTDSETILKVDNVVELWNKGNYTTVTGTPQQTVGLPAGKHMFPFKICLPPTLVLPSSLENPFGNIRYMLKAGISTSVLRVFEFITDRQISVNSLIDVNLPSFVLPLKRSNEKTACCCCCASGPIAMNVTTDRGAYCSGESIAITVITENFSSRQIRHVEAYLKQTLRFHGEPTQNGRAMLNASNVTREITETIQSIKGPADWHNKLMSIPVTVPTITSSQIIQVTYALDVYLSIRNAISLHTNIPIVIGSIPYKGSSAGTSIILHACTMIK